MGQIRMWVLIGYQDVATLGLLESRAGHSGQAATCNAAVLSCVGEVGDRQGAFVVHRR